MTLGERIGQIKIRSADGYPGSDYKWDDRYIAACLGDSFSALLKEKIWKETDGTSLSGLAGSCLTTTYNHEVVCDEERDLWYIVPSDYMTGLPGEQGIKMLAPMKSMANAYNLLPENFLATYANSPALNLEGGSGYWPETVSGQRRFYLHNHTKDSPKYFLFMFVPRITNNTDENMELTMPDDLWEDVIERTMKKLGVTPDDTNNGNSDRS